MMQPVELGTYEAFILIAQISIPTNLMLLYSGVVAVTKFPSSRSQQNHTSLQHE
jgi:hypothetical protein